MKIWTVQDELLRQVQEQDMQEWAKTSAISPLYPDINNYKKHKTSLVSILLP